MSKKEKSNLQEEKVAKKLNGKTTAGSGNQFHSKGDVKTDNYLIECKTTEKFDYTIKYKELRKIYQEAVEINKTPVLCFEFSKLNQRFYIVRESFVNRDCLPLSQYRRIDSDGKSSIKLTSVLVNNVCLDSYFYLILNKVMYLVFCEPYFLSIQDKLCL